MMITLHTTIALTQPNPPPFINALPSTEISVIIALLCFVVRQSVVQQQKSIASLEAQQKELVKILTGELSELKNEIVELNTRMEKTK